MLNQAIAATAGGTGGAAGSMMPFYLCAAATALYAYRLGRRWWIWGPFGFFLFLLAPLALYVVQRRSTPTLAKYLAAHPHCSTGRGIACFHCRSNSIRLWHRSGVLRDEQMHLCNHCGTHLYRS